MKLSINQNNLRDLCKLNNISYLGIFGSYSRGDEKKTSDIDLLIDFKKTKSFFELAPIQAQFEKIFRKPIDLVLKNRIKKSFKPYIYKDLIPLYEKK
ncbi:nucleotidyltransferase domain-containing protein [Candidatus Roizmanbacteria bacterium]|nr:nucleotidyltransferase domain-containing protein [Candidatus Roizmanbacteria bacterium]